jgi:hypothetical protein
MILYTEFTGTADPFGFTTVQFNPFQNAFGAKVTGIGFEGLMYGVINNKSLAEFAKPVFGIMEAFAPD